MTAAVSSFFSPATVAVTTAVVGCHANVVSLEQLLQTPEGRAFSSCLTFFQFLFVGLVSLRYLVTWGPTRGGNRGGKPASPSSSSSLSLPRLRPLRVSMKFHTLIAVSFWAISFFNNYALSLGIPVPAHTVFRSSSLLFNTALGYFAFARRYSVYQIGCAFVIVVGLIVLSLAPTHFRGAEERKGEEGAGPSDATPQIDVAQWFKGIVILACVSSITPLLSLVQERAMAYAKRRTEGDSSEAKEEGKETEKRESDAAVAEGEVEAVAYAPLWAEMTCCAHLLSLPLFAAALADGPATVAALFAADGSGASALYIAANLVTQYLCVSSVYQLVAVVGSFTMTFTITMRKFLSLLFSIFYFGHYRQLSPVEWVAILGIGIAGAAYPFLPKGGDAAAEKQQKSVSTRGSAKSDTKRKAD